MQRNRTGYSTWGVFNDSDNYSYVPRVQRSWLDSGAGMKHTYVVTLILSDADADEEVKLDDIVLSALDQFNGKLRSMAGISLAYGERDE